MSNSLALVPIDAAITFDAITMDPGTGAKVDADSAPTYDVFEDANDTPILAAQTMTKRTSKTGTYRGTITASAANGFEAGKFYNVDVTATVTNSVSSVAITSGICKLNFRCGPAEAVSGVPKADSSYFAGQTITAAAGVTWPTTVASPTNITAGTITTATNLTTNNDKTGYSIGSGGIQSTSFATAAIDAAAIATDAMGSAELSATAVTKIAAGVFAFAFPAAYGSYTCQQILELIVASQAGKTSGAASTTFTIRNLADSADVIVATVDASGDRSAVTLTP